MIDLRILEIAAMTAKQEMKSAGESYIDNDILYNMESYTDILDHLVTVLQDNATDTSRYQASVKKISDVSIKFLRDLRDSINDTLEEYDEQERRNEH